MGESLNQQVVLTSRPQGIPQANHFAVITSEMPSPADGEILVRNHYLSVEPAMRGWVSSEANYSEPVPVGDVMRAFTAGIIVESRHPDYAAGEYATGLFGWQDYAVVDVSKVIRKVSTDRVPLSTCLGVLGLNGLTAWFGLLEVCEPKEGDTVVVSTAAGSVGSCVGQIAKAKGCRTIGITGGPTKRALCEDVYGYDLALDYKDADFSAALTAALADGVDVYFDNTCGPISDQVMCNLNIGARIAICGTASIAEWNPLPQGPRVNRQLLVARARLQGLLVFDYVAQFEDAWPQLEAWVADGTIAYREDIQEGIESAPDAIASLYRGENLGKRLIRLVDIE